MGCASGKPDEAVEAPPTFSLQVSEPPSSSASAPAAKRAAAEISAEVEPPPAYGDSEEAEDDPAKEESTAALVDPAGASGKTFIRKDVLGPESSLMDPVQPDWRFELERDKWRGYSLEESMTLDRYWKVFCQKRDAGTPEVCLAKVMLMKKMGDVDFQQMTCTVGAFRPRKLQRQVKDAGWLSNLYFWEAFKCALAASGEDVGRNGGAEDVFDYRFNQDFRVMKDDGRPLHRGGQRYELPIGWKRFAIHVQGRYDDGDNSWLKEDESGWAVAYHGTTGAGLGGILSSGFNVGARQKFADAVGSGIYCTPEIKVAQHYSKPQMQDGHSVQIVLQLRVRPSAINKISSPTATEFEKKYWVINNPEEIRAYGVLIRELDIMDYVCPEEMVFGKDHPAVQKIYKELRGR